MRGREGGREGGRKGWRERQRKLPIDVREAHRRGGQKVRVIVRMGTGEEGREGGREGQATN